MLGDNIRNIRKSNDISINTLSKLTGISLGYLSDLENNKSKNPTKEKLDTIAQALGVSIEELLTEAQLTKDINKEIPQKYKDKYKITSRDKKQYLSFKESIGAFFMDDAVGEEDKEQIYRDITELFWKAKEKNKKKYGRKK